MAEKAAGNGRSVVFAVVVMVVVAVVVVVTITGQWRQWQRQL